jgi:signal peptidase I
MNLNPFSKSKKERKVISPARDWVNSITFAVVAATLIRWTTVEAYVIPTPSMENTALVGDYLFVSKFHYGTRTTSAPLQVPLTHQKIWGTDIPSYLDWGELPAYRLPGFSEVKRSDLVVFNVPPVGLNDGQLHPITLKTNYVKRCVGIGGDVLRIEDKQVIVNGIPLDNPANVKYSYIVTSRDEINKRNLLALDMYSDDYQELTRTSDHKVIYKMLLTDQQRETFKSLPYIISVDEDQSKNSGPEEVINPYSKWSMWNGDNYGPYTIPKKGMTIAVNDSTMAFYGEIISLYEHHDNVRIRDGQLLIDDRQHNDYTFRQDYFFMMGDNRHDSWDSRYWGLVPHDHIVGKALFVWFSWETEADWSNKVRWSRIFKGLH